MQPLVSSHHQNNDAESNGRQDSSQRLSQNAPLQHLLNQGRVWHARQGGERSLSRFKTQASGYQQLDQQLLGGGWQSGNLVELLYDKEGSGELRLLLPLLARLSKEERWLIWVDPPHIPYAPALAAAGIDTDKILMVHSKNRHDRLWTLEQALKSGGCSAVIGWLPQASAKAVRRLQVAAGEGATLGFICRPRQCQEQSSSAPYRVSLEPQLAGVGVTLLKRKNGWAMPTQQLSLGEDQLLHCQQSPLSGHNAPGRQRSNTEESQRPSLQLVT
ncbi:MAG: translesion DNA synthesis-associated protein ImuA [Motiliproteus sp.]